MSLTQSLCSNNLCLAKVCKVLNNEGFDQIDIFVVIGATEELLRRPFSFKHTPVKANTQGNDVSLWKQLGDPIQATFEADFKFNLVKLIHHLYKNIIYGHIVRNNGQIDA